MCGQKARIKEGKAQLQWVPCLAAFFQLSPSSCLWRKKRREKERILLVLFPTKDHHCYFSIWFYCIYFQRWAPKKITIDVFSFFSAGIWASEIQTKTRWQQRDPGNSYALPIGEIFSIGRLHFTGLVIAWSYNDAEKVTLWPVSYLQPP